MDLLISPKTKYLLEAGIIVLHQQSNEWLSDLAFYRDEAAFFYTLVVKKTMRSVPVDSKEQISKLETGLINVGLYELNELQKKMEDHESQLSNLLEKPNPDETNYRQEHKELAHRMEKFEKRFRDLKKEVFLMVEKIDLNKEA